MDRLRRHGIELEGADIRLYSSTHHGGVGEIRKLEASIRSGVVAKVIIITCWIGHSHSRSIVGLCKRRGVVVERANGSGEVKQLLGL